MLVIGSIEIKKEEKNVMFWCKRRLIMNKGKDMASMDSAEYLRKSDVSENSKVYWNKKYCFISKSRLDIQYLENSVSHWYLVERWRWNWIIKGFCWSLYYASTLLGGQASSPCHDFLLLFHNIQIINVILSSLCSTCSKWMHFQHVLSSWELQQITHMLYVTEIAGKLLSTLFLMFKYILL